jgi:alpha-glutamyl/putrescinyl thymine pyrophosphorylase clade 1
MSLNARPILDTYWRFAVERQAIFHRRLANPIGPWTDDVILRSYRFTNAYRASDRVSQFLIREVQYRSDRSQSPPELLFRTLLFKIFNRIETWKQIERETGEVHWEGVDLDAIARVLSSMMQRGISIYSAAYIMPSPPFGRSRKHENHLALLARMMEDRLPDRLERATSLRQVYEALLAYPGIGSFLAFQYAIDLNYSAMLDFSESDFVVAGPGALDGIAKCFETTARLAPQHIIYWTAERQDAEFARLGLKFQDLFGRPLQPIDCQNIYCEIAKYARVSHPELAGVSGRRRIKQKFHRNPRPLPPLMYPPKWGLAISAEIDTRASDLRAGF